MNPPSFKELLAAEKCWDDHVEQCFQTGQLPPAEYLLQNRAELEALCQFMWEKNIRSYLEIGIWTGRLVSTLERLFNFDTVATCDLAQAHFMGLTLRLPKKVKAFWGSSHSDEYRQWRADLGHIDMVMIDGDHSYLGVKRDFEINRQYPHRFLVFHDIANIHPSAMGVMQFWKELEGNKLTFHFKNPDAGPEVTPMGIGVWWQD